MGHSDDDGCISSATVEGWTFEECDAEPDADRFMTWPDGMCFSSDDYPQAVALVLVVGPEEATYKLLVTHKDHEADADEVPGYEEAISFLSGWAHHRWKGRARMTVLPWGPEWRLVSDLKPNDDYARPDPKGGRDLGYVRDPKAYAVIEVAPEHREPRSPAPLWN